MRKFVFYTRSWLKHTPTKYLWVVSIFTFLLIFFNYSYDLQNVIAQLPLPSRHAAQYFMLLASFAIPYGYLWKYSAGRPGSKLVTMVFLAPAIYTVKMIATFEISLTYHPYWSHYWNHVLQWPLLLCYVVLALWLVKKWLVISTPAFYGFHFRNQQWKFYLLVILFMIPLIIFASLNQQFLTTYPKVNHILPVTATNADWFYILLYEISYGLDFVTTELFFRGFLVIGFIKFAGKDAILPMAAFYCTIHFGKPAAECISSYFGGILAGIIVYNTRSIAGILLVHLGIAWLMELGGYIGNM